MSLQFPNVPNLPGVPQIIRQLGITIPPFIPGIPILGNVLAQASQSFNVWGVFSQPQSSAQSPEQVVNPDSIREFSTRSEWRISNFPVQQGSFMVKGGSIDERQQFESEIDALAASIALYTIITPEKSYLNCNVSRFEKTRRGARDAFFTVVDLFFVQIIQVNATYSTTANASVPNALPNASLGTVVPQPVTQASQNILNSVGIQ